METMNSISAVLSAMRRETGRSQRQVAYELGVSQALLSHYENGVREPKLDFIIKACDYYGVSADYVLGRVNERTSQNLPAPRDCKGASQLTSTANELFKKLEELGDSELYEAVVDYLIIPIENMDTLLRSPEMLYEPARDAELKLAEARFITLARRQQHEKTP